MLEVTLAPWQGTAHAPWFLRSNPACALPWHAGIPDAGDPRRLQPLRRTALTSLLLLGLTLTPSAGAQERGVFVDPESPAGKEYAIPLEQARREAAGGAGGREGGAGGSGSGAQPLFGVGIGRAKGASASGGDGTAASGGADGSKRGGDGQAGGKAPGAGDLAPSARSSAAIEAAASEGSDTLLTAGIAAAVLGAGLLAGFGLRRLLRDG